MSTSRFSTRPAAMATWSLVAVVLLACDGDESRIREPRGDLIISELDTIRLAESEDVFIGRSADLFFDAERRSYFVAEALSDRVFEYDEQGTLKAIIGARGDGPGELAGVFQIMTVGDSLAVTDVGDRQIEWFDLRTGAHVGSTPYTGILGSLDVEDGRLWIGSLDLEGRSTFLIPASDGQGFRRSGRVPGAYYESNALSGIFNGVVLTVSSDTVHLGVSGTNQIQRWVEGKITAEVTIPTLLRKGVPEDVAETMASRSFPEIYSSISGLMHLHRLSNGDLVLLHFDQVREGHASVASVYLSVLRADLKAACVDHPIDVARVSRPRFAFNGDTILVLEQEIADQSPVAWIRRLALSYGDCPVIDGEGVD